MIVNTRWEWPGGNGHMIMISNMFGHGVVFVSSPLRMSCHSAAHRVSPFHCMHESYKVWVVVCNCYVMQSGAFQVRMWSLLHKSVKTPLHMICCLVSSWFWFTIVGRSYWRSTGPYTYKQFSWSSRLVKLHGWDPLKSISKI